ncbi:LysE family transporter [Luedemannella helvata]|uniref:LysE family transporter n=1 Tax=Luedemannella helvata TaxID=349315 RepID=A0ABN2KN01_9ACTN
MVDALISGVLAGYGIAVPVGAIAVLIVSLTARTSFAVGAGGALGVATADGLYALAAVLGGAALAAAIEPVATPMRWIAAAALLVIAVRTAGSAIRHHRGPAQAAGTRASGLSTPGRAYLALLGLTILNPATIIYFAALVIGRQAAGDGSVAASIVFVAAAFVASASWQLLLAAGGTAIGRLLTGPRGRLVTAVVSSVVIAALAVWLVAG